MIAVRKGRKRNGQVSRSEVAVCRKPVFLTIAGGIRLNGNLIRAIANLCVNTPAFIRVHPFIKNRILNGRGMNPVSHFNGAVMNRAISGSFPGDHLKLLFQ